jgi:hypothetical protein
VCVDIFRRADGTYGFDTFRRDPEDQRGWYSIGHFGDQTYDSEHLATSAAVQAVDWFNG